MEQAGREPDHGRDAEIPGRPLEEVMWTPNDCRPGFHRSRHAPRDERGLSFSGEPQVNRFTCGSPLNVERDGPATTTTAGRVFPAPGRICGWLLVLVASAAVAHGCHTGDHGDADLLTRLVTVAGSSPAAVSPETSPAPDPSSGP